MKVYTNLNVLKEAWKILKELGLEKLISGGKPEKVDIGLLLNKLLSDGMLFKFCQVITKSDTDFGSMELDEIFEVVVDFFSHIGGGLEKLLTLVKAVPKK